MKGNVKASVLEHLKSHKIYGYDDQFKSIFGKKENKTASTFWYLLKLSQVAFTVNVEDWMGIKIRKLLIA